MHSSPPCHRQLMPLLLQKSIHPAQTTGVEVHSDHSLFIDRGVAVVITWKVGCIGESVGLSPGVVRCFNAIPGHHDIR